ncbi:MAG TPA: glycosyltransferase family 2 protein [Pirellulaceae bacterium]|nr:glycosyltransferase family 2 protein [Pirellulaceae bacterium]
MLIIAAITFSLCVVLTVGQCVVVAAFLWNVIRQRTALATEAPLPKAAIVLALRGPDPFLDECVRRLVAQQYPDYTIFLIVDSEEDPVLKDVERVLDETAAENVVVSVLRDPYNTCSLKCSALIQAVRELDASYEVVAFLDGDALPHPTWLTELVTPLSDAKIGVTYGNRWYVPTSRSWGTWVRYCWNVGAVIQVWLNDIIWAGSMALKTKTIQEIGLLDAWSRALSVDATVHRQLRKHNLKVLFVPTVMMVNRETISLARFVRWVQRQMVASKSCGAGWRLVGVHAVNLVATQLLALAMLFAGCFMKNQSTILLSGSGLALYWGSALVAIAATEWSMRKTVHSNGEEVRWNRWTAAIYLVPAFLLTQVAYPYALGVALFRRRVDWRGVEYDVRGVNDIRMRNYRSYMDSQASVSESIV